MKERITDMALSNAICQFRYRKDQLKADRRLGDSVLFHFAAEIAREYEEVRAAKPVARVSDHYSRDGFNDEITVYLPVGTELYAEPRPAALPGGFTLDDARELHKNLVICHTSQALSGERMSPAERGNDLAWIRDVAVTAAWFVNAIIESTKPEVSDE